MTSPPKIKVLFLDDEPNNVASFKAAFRLDFKVLTATTASEAERLLELHPDIHVVLSDQRMPGKTGAEFLHDIQQRFPLPVRILVTGYTDIESVIQAINQGRIFRYIAKPWIEQDVRSALQEAYQYYTTYSLLMQNNEELRTANEELDQFAHNLTHDIRGPIVSALGATDILQESDNLYEIREIAAMMRASLQKLDNYVADLNDFYLLKRTLLQKSDIWFEAIAADMQRIFSMQALLHQITFSTQVVQESAFPGYEVPLRIILTNLLDNAFRYQRPEELHKEVKLLIKVGAKETVIEVSDNGAGIDKEHLQQVFQLFYRASNYRPGSGFGLYNVQTALKKLNGRIEVHSECNKGTTFILFIPAQ